MSIFGSIKKAIFGDDGPLGGQFSGRKEAPAAPPPPAAPPAPGPATHPQTIGNERPAPVPPVPASAPQPPAAPRPPAAPQPSAPSAAVDVEQLLEARAAAAGQPLNWRTSIVDLMKLLGLDPSLANRKELADELGYAGAKDGSAEMNTWLIKAVMRELEKNGGTVPAALKD